MRHPLRALAPLALLVTAVAALFGANLPEKPSNLQTPVHQRLSIKGLNAIAVGWDTYAEIAQACVQYGTDPDDLDKQACATPGTSTIYQTSRTWFHAVTLEKLKSDTLYYYQIKAPGATTDWFRSPITPGDDTPFNVAVAADLGVYGKDGFRLDGDDDGNKHFNDTTFGRVNRIKEKVRFWLHPGDVEGYPDLWYLRVWNLPHPRDAYIAIIETMMNQASMITKNLPWMVGPGNHEASCQAILFPNTFCPEGQSNFTDYNYRFGPMMPSTFTSTSDLKRKILANKARKLASPPFWYSFDYGMVHFVMINTETDFKKAPDAPGGSTFFKMGPFGAKNQQIEFLNADLASVDRKVTPWVVVSGHRPWYTANGGCKPCQNAFEFIFYKFAVDLAIFGHVHNSQRFHPMVNGKVDDAGYKDPKAPMYIIAGGAGNIQGLDKIKDKDAKGNAFAYDDDFAMATLTFKDRQHLQVQFIRSRDGEQIDAVELYKEHEDRFPNQRWPGIMGVVAKLTGGRIHPRHPAGVS